MEFLTRRTYARKNDRDEIVRQKFLRMGKERLRSETSLGLGK